MPGSGRVSPGKALRGTSWTPRASWSPYPSAGTEAFLERLAVTMRDRGTHQGRLYASVPNPPQIRGVPRRRTSVP